MVSLSGHVPVKATAYLALLAGLAMFTGLIAYHGFAEVGGALAVAGWGLVLIALFHVVPIMLNTMSWRALLKHGSVHAPMGFMLWARWIAESINALLPVAQVGGDWVKARLAMRHGIPAPIAGASVMVDLTVSVFAQIVFTLLGLALLLVALERNDIIATVLAGMAIIGVLVATFYVIQRRGLFVAASRLLERLFDGRDWSALIGSAAAMDDVVSDYYGQKRLLLVACGWRLLGWSSGVGEVWLAMYFLGAPVSLLEACLLESLGQAIRAAAFMVPGALGVQEGGFLILGALLGLTPEAALALSLCKRVRELLLGVPGLIAWQYSAGKDLWMQRRAGEPGQAMAAERVAAKEGGK
ncbi:MAG: flippase-like domain-containing protein [Mariprofundaceae bacterium]